MISERVTNKYEHLLQCAFWDIGNRGIRVAPDRIQEASAIVDAEILRNLAVCSNQWGCAVFVGRENAPEELDEDDPEFDPNLPGATNINSTKGRYALLEKLKELGYNVPKITKKDEETGEYDQAYSTGELAVQKMLSDNQFGYPGGDPALRAILRIREYGKLKNNYLNARLLARGSAYFFLSRYNVAGTTTGRRSSRRHTFGFGGNDQNFPKHSKVASLFRRCLVAREGQVFLFVDQIQAEDWPVSALAQNAAALHELRTGVDRHSALATLIWGHFVPPKGSPEWNEALHDMERFIGKKARHANNYDMRAGRFRDVLAQDAGLAVSDRAAKDILDKVNKIDPSIKGVFHKYVQDTLSQTRTLITPAPFFRERQFLSIRPTDLNSNAVKEAYAFIPQSTVADNTGVAVLQLENAPAEQRSVIQEGHDSIAQDIPDNSVEIYKALARTQVAFARKIKFQNGIEIEIPIEAELGYDFDKTVKIKSFTPQGVAAAREKLQDLTHKSNIVQIAVGA